MAEWVNCPKCGSTDTRLEEGRHFCTNLSCRDYLPSEEVYDARTAPTTPLKDCQDVVGMRGRLVLTGRFVQADERESGGFVYFELDDRFGFPEGTRMGMDLEAFEMDEDGTL